MKLGIDIPARDNCHRFFGDLNLARQQCRERDRSARLDRQAMFVPGEAHCLAHLRLADRQVTRAAFPQDGEGDRKSVDDYLDMRLAKDLKR